MIPLAELNAVAERYHVPADTIEKDYMICWILASLSRSPLREGWILYGGTAIKRIYFEDHRFSEDIDLVSPQVVTLRALHEQLAEALTQARDTANVVMTVAPDRTLIQEARARLVVRYTGYEEIVGAPKEIRLDCAMGRERSGDTQEGSLLRSYSDLTSHCGTFPVQTLNTLLAGKLGLLIEATRKEPRDLFDLWFLLQRLDRFRFSLGRVCSAFTQRYGYPPSFSLFEPHLENRLYRERWETRLHQQIAHLPAIDVVIMETRRRLEQLFARPPPTSKRR